MLQINASRCAQKTFVLVDLRNDSSATSSVSFDFLPSIYQLPPSLGAQRGLFETCHVVHKISASVNTFASFVWHPIPGVIDPVPHPNSVWSCLIQIVTISLIQALTPVVPPSFMFVTHGRRSQCHNEWPTVSPTHTHKYI